VRISKKLMPPLRESLQQLSAPKKKAPQLAGSRAPVWGGTTLIVHKKMWDRPVKVTRQTCVKLVPAQATGSRTA
jgi:hypothetical protein